jgi:hypothetical protein
VVTQIQPDSNIPPHIYELATTHHVGTPLKKQRRRLLQIVLILEILFGLCLLGLLGYYIYGYVAFNFLLHTYPDINSVPDNQLDHYISLQALHDQFWPNILQETSLLLTWLGQFMVFYVPVRTQLYFCTDGLLKIGRKKVEAVRWDEVKDLYSPRGSVTRLVKEDGSDLSFPQLLLSGRRNTLNTLITDQVTQCLLPAALVRYERGETITFEDLKVSQKGIEGPEGMVEWERIGDIAREKHKLLLYYKQGEPSIMKSTQNTPMFDQWQWHTWKKNALTAATWPNMPLFMALVRTILDQRSETQEEPLTHSQQTHTIQEKAALAKRRNRRRKCLVITAIILSLLVILSLIIGIPTYQAAQEQQRADRDAQLLRTYFTALAHKPYSARVPGEHCGDGKNFWLDDDPKNAYTCRTDGLLMTQKNMQYVDGEWFTFVPDTLSMSDRFSSVNYFPHHYRVQVKATILSGGPDTCVSLEVHVQDFQGNQSFDICADGTWFYDRCDLHCDTDTIITGGNLPQMSPSYLITVEVTDSVLSLQVNHAAIASVEDHTYTSTNQLQLTLDGGQHPIGPVTALFSDFSYTPLA